MYKTKLQVECQRRQWGLPKYSAMKDGPDHNPRFKVSVSVNGMSFDSPILCRSSKDAHNEAAKVAFLHFTSPASSTLCSEPIVEGLKFDRTSQSLESQSHTLDVKDDLWCQYKNQLQNYTQWKNLDSPLYSSTSEGPFHALRFKATVTVEGRAFESPGFFKNLKEAEQAAAKAALKSLALDGFQLDCSGYYKSLLIELAQREGLCIPIYKTIRSGPPHEPTFFSTVEIEGEKFHGQAGKSKKLAEIKAARIAYTALKERALSQTVEFTSLSLMTDETHKSTPSSASTTTVDLENLEHECPPIKYDQHAEESKDEVKQVDLPGDSILAPIMPHMDKMMGNWESTCSESAPSLPKDNPSYSDEVKQVDLPGDSILAPIMPHMDKMMGNWESTCSESAPSLPKDNPSYSDEVKQVDLPGDSILAPIMSHMDKMMGNWESTCSESAPSLPKDNPSSSELMSHDLSALSIADSNMKKTTSTQSYLLCNRVRVYTCFPNIEFPKDITVLPISDNKWVAVSLEFPNEKGN